MNARYRVEAREPMPLVPGCCDWCGGQVPPTRAYCSTACRQAYGNLLARQGKAVMQMLKVWRKHRGGKGTPGEGMISQIAARVDQMLEEDRARITEARSLPASKSRQSP